MQTITVNATKTYDVLIGPSLLNNVGEISREYIGSCRCVIITDTNVDKLYSSVVESSLSASGFKVSKFVFEAGERSKNPQTLIEILEFMANNELTRSDCVFALGGGVVGDIAGFASAIYLRGIKFVQIPTTLLAAVDSSVGGKTGIDLCAGKNLAGAFHQPSLVICDHSTLNTLTNDIFSDGCAEVIKYGVINDNSLFELVNNGVRENIEEIILHCVENKSKIVAQDEFDNGCRQLLNLGHTVGHAIEKCSNYAISHGSAVSIGMVIVMRAAVSLGYCSSDALDRLIALLKKVNLPTSCTYTAEQLASVCLSDKKRKGDTITLVIPHDIGDTRLMPIHTNDIEAFIEKGLS